MNPLESTSVALTNGVREADTVQILTQNHRAFTRRRSCEPTAGEAESQQVLVTLVGFYGRGNFGDDAMGRALIGFLVQELGVSVRILTSDPNVYADLAAPVDVVQFSAASVVRSAFDSDVICQGGGTHFHDSYTGIRTVRHWWNLLKWAGLFWLSRACGAKVVMVGAGVGPLGRRISRWISGAALSACNSICVRDQASAALVLTLSNRVPCHVGFDLAGLDAPNFPSTVKPPATIRSVAICPCSLSEFSHAKHHDERYWAPLADALAILHRDNPIRIIFLCLFSGCSAVPDSAIARLIADRLPIGVPIEFRVYQGQLDQFFGEFSGDHAFLCSKYHSAVAAYLAKRKFAVIGYNKKVMDFADEIHLDADLRIKTHEPQPSTLWLTVLRKLLAQKGPCPATMPVELARNKARQAVLRVFDMLPLRRG